jgi:hypothetical protein
VSIAYLLPAILVVYIVVVMVSNTQVLSWWMLVFPLYSLCQVVILPPLGIYTYAQAAWTRRDMGRYRFGYRRPREGQAPKGMSRGISPPTLAGAPNQETGSRR